MGNKEKVTCPICGWYLLNKDQNAKGKLEIKCQRCKQIVEIELDNHKK